MNQNHADITIVLDRSGSMEATRKDTIGGFNRFLSDQKKAPGTASITLHQFDTEHEIVMEDRDVKSAPELTHATFVPRGSTALLDAIGRGIESTGKRLSLKSDADRAGKVIFVIITDGEENASKEYSRPKIFDMIKHQTEKYNWQFVFLGANQDAIQTGRSIGVATTNSMTYTAAGVMDSFDSLTSNSALYRSGGKASMAFEPEDYKKQADAAKNPI